MTQRIYFAYLLRMWREKPESPWRAMLENPQSGERIGFAEIADLVTYITEQTEAIPASVAPESNQPSIFSSTEDSNEHSQ